MSQKVPWPRRIPPSWKRERVKHIASLRAGSAITSSSITSEETYPVFGGNGIRGFTSDFTHSGRHVLIGRQGALCGNINYASGRFWASEHAVVVTTRGDDDVDWLGELLRSMNLNQFSRSAAQPGISVNVIANLEIPVPPHPVQRAIARFLERENTRTDGVVRKKRQMIDLVLAQRTGLLLEAVAPSLAPRRWRTTRLKFLFQRPQAGAWGEEPAGTDQDVLCVRVADFDRQRLVVSERAETTRSIDPLTFLKCRLQPGDVLIEKSGGGDDQPVGFAVSVGSAERAICSNFIARLRPLPDMVPEYAGLVMAAAYRLGRNIPFIKQTTGIQNLDLSAYLGEPWVVPPVEEQERIVQDLGGAFGRFDRIVGALEEQIVLLLERRQALVTAAVAGELDIGTAT